MLQRIQRLCARWTHTLLLFLALRIFAGQIPALAQDTAVYGVFFYSPTCPHCRDVMQNDWPVFDAEFGDRLRVLFVDVSTEPGSRLMTNTTAALNVQSRGVPMLVIGTNVLLGAVEIPERAPNLIRAGLQAGGISLPPVAALEAEYQKALNAVSGGSPFATRYRDVIAAEQQPSVWERLTADPVANTLAVVVLVLLAAGLFRSFDYVWSDPKRKAKLSEASAALRRNRMVLLTAGLGLLLSGFLIVGANGDVGILLLAGVLLAVFAAACWLIMRAPHRVALPEWLLPLVAAGGFVVAGYLAYVELTLTDAVCGVVGNCNAVQQSEFAHFLGIPIGVIGLAGYGLIIGLWAAARRPSLHDRAQRLLRWSVLAGIIFSIYLTFLEPFVIGATCIWCLTSAVIMLLLLWLLPPERTVAHTGDHPNMRRRAAYRR